MNTAFPDYDGGYAASGHCHSFGWTAAAWALIGSTAVQIYSADQARSSSNQANDIAIANAKRVAADADRANNAANARSPDTAAMMASNLAAGKQGASGTMLTGPGGVDPSQLTLGKSSLLGG